MDPVGGGGGVRVRTFAQDHGTGEVLDRFFNHV